MIPGRSLLVATTLVLSSTLARAQLSAALGDLSPSCQASATSLLTSGFGTCANVISLATGVLGATGSVVKPFDTWLGGVCTQTCSPAVLANASAAIESGCTTDLASGEVIATALDFIVGNYTELKGVLCLQATSNSTYCLTNLLTDVESSTNTTLSPDTLTSLLAGGVSALSTFLSSIPPSALCTDCTHALVSAIRPVLNATEATAADQQVTTTCGSQFADGQIPSTVGTANSAGTSAVTSTMTGGAGGVKVGGVVGLVLVGAAMLV